MGFDGQKKCRVQNAECRVSVIFRYSEKYSINKNLGYHSNIRNFLVLICYLIISEPCARKFSLTLHSELCTLHFFTACNPSGNPQYP